MLSRRDLIFSEPFAAATSNESTGVFITNGLEIFDEDASDVDQPTKSNHSEIGAFGQVS